MNNNILVTGGSGFIGSNFIQYLINNSDYNKIISHSHTVAFQTHQDNIFPQLFFTGGGGSIWGLCRSVVYGQKNGVS